jgi:hypothetical protein
MNYKKFIETIISVATGITYSGTTGTTIVKWCEFCLTDEPELNPNTTYPAIFITPIPITFADNPMDDQVYFKARLYVLDNIAVDKSLRLTAYSKCLDIIMLIFEGLEDAGFIFKDAMDWTPVLLYDGNVDGGFIDITILDVYDCI